MVQPGADARAFAGGDTVGDRVTVNQLIVALLEYAVDEIRLMTAEASDEHLHYRPTAHANSIAWLVWHLSRWRDYTSASIAARRMPGSRRVGPVGLRSRTRPPDWAICPIRSPRFASTAPCCSGTWRRRTGPPWSASSD